MFVFFCMKSELLILHLLLTFIYKRMKNLFVFTKKSEVPHRIKGP